VHDVSNCSIGGVYVTILNLPRELFMKPRWTTLALVIPGPREPSKLAVNRVLQPLIDDLKTLEKGIFMQVAEAAGPVIRPVYAQALFCSSDIPAIRKFTGALGHSSTQFCNHCTMTLDELQTETAFTFQQQGAFTSCGDADDRHAALQPF
jgi:hypothetical protein